MISDRILLIGVFHELVREDHQLQVLDEAIRSGISVVVVMVDRWEIRALESQVVYGMETWDHEKQLEEPKRKKKYIKFGQVLQVFWFVNTSYFFKEFGKMITDGDSRRRFASVAPGYRIGFDDGMNGAICFVSEHDLEHVMLLC